jgi:hypothetical protein
VCTAFIITLMVEAVCTSETSVYYNDTTWRNIPEGSNLKDFCCLQDRKISSSIEIDFFVVHKIKKYQWQLKLTSRRNFVEPWELLRGAGEQVGSSVDDWSHL